MQMLAISWLSNRSISAIVHYQGGRLQNGDVFSFLRVLEEDFEILLDNSILKRNERKTFTVTRKSEFTQLLVSKDNSVSARNKF